MSTITSAIPRMDVFSAIGNSPLVELKHLNGKAPNVTVLAKLEGCNPGGSIKDRPAYYMIKAAEEEGLLTKDKTIIEPTSGNTGIALAMIGAAKGYNVKLYMPECVSVERQLILRAYGAEVELTPAKEGTDGAIRMAHRAITEEPGRYYMPNQFANPNNPLAHYETTGPEILQQTQGEIDYFVAGMGTSGTLMGVSRFLKEKKPSAKVIGVEPTPGHTIQGLKNMTEAIVPEIYHPEVLDEIIPVEDGEAFEATKILVTREGIFSGMSSGANVAGMLKALETIESGVVVVMLPDRGDRYLSTTLFRSICAKCPP